MTSELLYDVQAKIAHIQINRPGKLNSINPPLMAELSALFCRADEDAAVHVIVLSGVGPHFGAGYDLKYDWKSDYGTDARGA